MTQIDTDRLKAVALRNFNRIPGERGDTPHSYVETALLWLAEWCGAKKIRDAISPGYCAFVLAQETDGAIIPENAELVDYFKEDSTPELGGNIYLTDYALNKVLRCRGSCKDLNEVVNMVRENGFEGDPFVAFDTDSQAIYAFEDGAAEMTFRFILREELPRPFTIDVFEDVLDDIYDQNLKFPDVYPPIWHERKNRIPCKETELVIQGHIVGILKARAQGSRVSASESDYLTIAEEKNNAGRVDIAVYRDQACVVVSELKVLRHCRYPDPNKREKRLNEATTQEEREQAMAPITVPATTNEKWALRGARQAARYRVADGARSAALVLFDMRETDAELSSVKSQCDSTGVRYMKYYLYNEIPKEEET